MFQVPRSLSYEEWIELPENEADMIECSDCNGTGECYCHCGNDHPCGYCGGTGKINKADYATYEKSNRIYREAYLRWVQGCYYYPEIASLHEKEKDDNIPGILVLCIGNPVEQM